MSDLDDGGKAWPFGNKSRADRADQTDWADQFKGTALGLVYLAAPYSHPDVMVRANRFRLINRFASALIRSGVKVFSPISHSVPICEAGDLRTDWGFWREYDLAMLRRCEWMIVLKLDGWRESEGLEAEVTFADLLGIPVSYFRGREK